MQKGEHSPKPYFSVASIPILWVEVEGSGTARNIDGGGNGKVPLLGPRGRKRRGLLRAQSLEEFSLGGDTVDEIPHIRNHGMS